MLKVWDIQNKTSIFILQAADSEHCFRFLLYFSNLFDIVDFNDPWRCLRTSCDFDLLHLK